jgi:hypothetical protein
MNFTNTDCVWIGEFLEGKVIDQKGAFKLVVARLDDWDIPAEFWKGFGEFEVFWQVWMVIVPIKSKILKINKI